MAISLQTSAGAELTAADALLLSLLTAAPPDKDDGRAPSDDYAGTELVPR